MRQKKLELEIKTKGNIPMDGKSGAFGYGALTDGVFWSNETGHLNSACTNKPFFEKYHTIFMEYFLNFNSAPQKNHQFLRIA